MQRLALFDLDRTLIDLDAAFLRWADEFAKQHRLGPDGVPWLAALDRAGHPHRDVFFSKVREHFGLAEVAEELWAAYRQRMPHLVRCYPGVVDGLIELRTSGWRVGIVTNGTADDQLGKLRRTGLADAVDGYAVSGVEGVRKPDSRLFHLLRSQQCHEGHVIVGANRLLKPRIDLRVAKRSALPGRVEGTRIATEEGPAGEGGAKRVEVATGECHGASVSKARKGCL
ncbi:HAD family hydrolase [Nonomuraea rhodomycinica]|uniref:HAD family hydrolase n=1 Tax=Nonomuraea rhodomycinica TaxID=1712872 RepID=A0A7Y6ISK5_9ACTN|nr:HAD family hydrolase [Nonomuraea rhodomycinica]NUW43311.1 HAD family hydrolase [Nonomuraea rhodomycinica]